MLLKFLSLLLAFPLVLPQGMCVCHLAAPIWAEGEETGQAFAHGSCSEHEHGPDDQFCSGTERDQHRHGPIPTNSSDQHVPGCPALKRDFVLPSTTAHPIPVPVCVCSAFYLLPAANAAVVQTPARVSPDVSAGDPPRYLTLLTLRI